MKFIRVSDQPSSSINHKLRRIHIVMEEGEGKNPFRQQQVNALIRVGAEQRDVAKALRTLVFDVENMKSQETT